MNAENASNEVKSVAAATTDPNFTTLSETFDKCLKLLNSLENTLHPTNSENFQEIVHTGISKLEKATEMVNKVGIFSSNEIIEEVATADMKYLLLPALLGTFTLKSVTSSNSERLEKIKLAELYFKDFMKRCKDYELPVIKTPEVQEKECSSDPEVILPSKITNMAAERERKIKHYKLIKEIEQREYELKASLQQKSEEVMRDYYLTMLKRWNLMTLEELSSIKTEKLVLEHMSNMKKGPNIKEAKTKSKPLKPIIITRNELQKKVYGMGYPSIPAMTVDEFYQQRYPLQQDNSATAMNSLQQMAADPEFLKKEWELEDVQLEKNFEIDDPATLQRARGFDDWKDDNRRGCGNRKNKG